MSKNFKHIVTAGVSILMFTSVGAEAGRNVQAARRPVTGQKQIERSVKITRYGRAIKHYKLRSKQIAESHANKYHHK